jgi:hypothetical protein
MFVKLPVQPVFVWLERRYALVIGKRSAALFACPDQYVRLSDENGSPLAIPQNFSAPPVPDARHAIKRPNHPARARLPRFHG